MRTAILKKMFFCVFAFAVLLPAVILTGAADIYLGNYSKRVDGNLLYMYDSGYRNEPNTAILFKSYDKLVDYYQINREKYDFDFDRPNAKGYNIKSFKDIVFSGYDEGWFKDYDLVLSVSYEASSSYYYRLKSIDYVMTTAKIVLYRNSPNTYDCAMSGWHTFIEIEKKSYIQSAEVSLILT